ncbi:predicted protein [Chaetomium globosum CBS 148.51]|uniref:Uncharacterized protein n=1 Tax=Chaetomium globosum (strain ATCC 6205 / CBS 148.51 / DSM 1962 / NBRC 6347 / NRRL 1970) TaxID=306901 RepID=Q2H9A0_CHAGB|nr:uncharacterized protein CHGG_03204 [Chaetomium globosum CBS 148.51]EAQ91269.1 predicted protein [Chaetomium globosum CBS 148.51]
MARQRHSFLEWGWSPHIQGDTSVKLPIRLGVGPMPQPVDLLLLGSGQLWLLTPRGLSQSVGKPSTSASEASEIKAPIRIPCNETRRAALATALRRRVGALGGLG